MITQNFDLKDIDIGNMILVKEVFKWYGAKDHSRWVFKSRYKTKFKKGKSLYFKLWNPTYIRKDNILKAINAGFYDDIITPALIGLIFHKGVCRGYVMEECNPDWKLQLDEEYYELIKFKSYNTKIFNIQFGPCHVMKCDGKFSLIDLEGVFPISELPKMVENNSYFDFKDYENFILDIYNKNFADSDLKSCNFTNPNGYFRKMPPAYRTCQFIISKGLDFCRKKRGKHVNKIEII